MADYTNQFSVKVVNPLEALMAGEAGYKETSDAAKQNRMQAVREQAAQDVMQGGDPKSALARLLSVGDDKGAATLASVIHNQQQNEYQNKSLDVTAGHYKALEGQSAAQLSESSRHNKALEAASAAERDKPVIVPFGSGLVKRDGTVIREPGGGETGTLDETTLESMARQAAAGDMSVYQNLGRGAQGAANIVAIRKRVAQINAENGQGGADQAQRNAEFFGTKAGQRTLGTRSANIELAATEFQQVLPVVSAASKAVDRTNYPDLNKIIQAYNEKTGDPNIVRFGGGVNTLVNLYARAISPSGVPTVSDKDHAREILNKAWSQGQFDAAVGMMSQEIDAALKSPEKVRDEMRKRFSGGQPGSKPATSAAAAPPDTTTSTGVTWKIVQ